MSAVKEQYVSFLSRGDSIFSFTRGIYSSIHGMHGLCLLYFIRERAQAIIKGKMYDSVLSF
jgi:hypothetical protein